MGVEAGQLALGKTSFRDMTGEFWGFIETRPYMRARGGLALALLELGETDAAIGHLRAMLELNPNDNQGIRYVLLGTLLDREATDEVVALLDVYDADYSPYWAYTRLLLAFRAGKGAETATRRLLSDAVKINRHVPGLLLRPDPPPEFDAPYITVGDEDEAADYVVACGAAWRRTPGAIDWLASLVARPARAPAIQRRPRKASEPR